MNPMIYAIVGLALASTVAQAEPVTPNTITGYAASVAVARGVPVNPTVRNRDARFDRVAETRAVRIKPTNGYAYDSDPNATLRGSAVR